MGYRSGTFARRASGRSHPEDERLTITGNLRTMPLADLFQWLSASHKTGTLVIDGSAYTKRIYFQRGDVVAVSSDYLREMLGYYLVGWGYCSEEELRVLVEKQETHGVMLGELVVHEGFLTRDEFAHLLLVKTEEAIYDLILWEDANFRFLDDELPSRDFIGIPLPVTSFLLEGFRQRDERRRMRKVVPDVHHIPVPIMAPDDLDEDEQRVAAAIDGSTSIAGVALRCRRPEFEVLTYVYRCVQSGLMRLSPPPPGGETIPGSSSAPWIDSARKAKDRIDRGRLLDAFQIVRGMEGKHRDRPEAVKLVGRLMQELVSKLDEDAISRSGVLEPTVRLEELVHLKCEPEEGFVLSRVNGYYTLHEVLAQLPGETLHNRVVIHNLFRRGLIKVRDATSVRRYRRQRVVDSFLQSSDDLDDPFQE